MSTRLRTPHNCDWTLLHRSDHQGFIVPLWRTFPYLLVRDDVYYPPRKTPRETCISDRFVNWLSLVKLGCRIRTDFWGYALLTDITTSQVNNAIFQHLSTSYTTPLSSMSDEITLLPRHFKPLEKNQIRILVLYSSKDPNAPLVGHHELQTLAGKDDADQALGWKDYSALSYRWGDIAKKGSITLDTGQLEISLNAQQAISKTRHHKNNTRLWVDVICINHDDTWEKTSQVCLMDRIYSQATSVVIWLNNDDEQEFLLERGVSIRTGKSEYKPGEIELAKTSAPERISLHDWVYRWWTAYMKLSMVSDLRILCGSVEFSCNRTGDCSVLRNSRVVQIKCGEPKTRDLGKATLDYPVVREIEQALSFNALWRYYRLLGHLTAPQYLYPRQNKDFKSRLWPDENNTYGDLNFPRKTKGYATKSAALETCAVDSIPSSMWFDFSKKTGRTRLLLGNQESIAHEYGRSNANRKVLADASTDPLPCNNNIKTSGTATERAETRSSNDCPNTDVTAIQGYMMFWTCVSSCQLCSTVDTRCVLSTHSNITS
jgi:hypothetical protein